MTRRKSIIKILFIALAVLLLAVFFAGCGEYKPPENSGSNPNLPSNPVDPNPPVDPDDPEADYFTVTLTHYDGSPFTSADYSMITELQAQWTEVVDGNNRAEVYRAQFNENGVARIGFRNSEFKVTLVMTERFASAYTYDPNPARPERMDELVTYRDKQDVTVPLYALKSIGELRYMNIGSVNTGYYLLNETGAYSYTLKSRTDKQMFFYNPQLLGEYSFMTLIDVTADEINPIVDLHRGQAGAYVNPTPELTQNDGGAEGKYTKNIWLKYQISEDEVAGGSLNCLMFNLYSESEKPDAYPLTVYFIIERDGEFTRPVEESVTVPVTEDFTKTPETPEGTFRFVGARIPKKDGAGYETNTQHILNEKHVKYYDPESGGDGYYYYINVSTNDFYREADGTVSAQYRLYAMITGNNQVHDMFTNPLLARGLNWVTGSSGVTKNYYDFITDRIKGYSGHVNRDGAYPVNAELRQFLQDYAVSQRLFNDGNGFAEWAAPDGPDYNSDEDSQWLYACGLYS
ncbi:MAG: hypothetical protein K2J54_01360 [Clostridia bacterium]|nr:hypothetical protein [Clostridia bacterium]